MGVGIKIIVVVIVLIAIVMVVQNGWEGIRAEPFDSTIQASQTIGNKTIDAFNKGKEIINNFKNNENNNTNLVEIGQIPCNDDSQCNQEIGICENNCICQDSICWKIN